MSVSSPVARTLLGHAEGDTVRIVRPRGAETCTIVAVAYPDAPSPAGLSVLRATVRSP